MHVLDSSAIFSRHIPEGVNFITPEVYEEIKDDFSKNDLQSYLSSGKITVQAPKLSDIETVRKILKKSGDLLSDADISVLALAHELDAILVTDDYGIQNTAEYLKISWSSPKTNGIAKRIRWGKKCSGCGKKYDTDHGGVCDICGSKLKKYIREKGK